jgi:hypothetical protein
MLADEICRPSIFYLPPIDRFGMLALRLDYAYDAYHVD